MEFLLCSYLFSAFLLPLKGRKKAEGQQKAKRRSMERKQNESRRRNR
jgi:hypothetical protein